MTDLGPRWQALRKLAGLASHAVMSGLDLSPLDSFGFTVDAAHGGPRRRSLRITRNHYIPRSASLYRGHRATRPSTKQLAPSYLGHAPHDSWQPEKPEGLAEMREVVAAKGH